MLCVTPPCCFLFYLSTVVPFRFSLCEVVKAYWPIGLYLPFFTYIVADSHGLCNRQFVKRLQLFFVYMVEFSDSDELFLDTHLHL